MNKPNNKHRPDVDSQLNMIALTLNKNLDCNDLCKKIGEYVEGYYKENGDLSDHVLVININKIIDSQENSQTPKIEYRQ